MIFHDIRKLILKVGDNVVLVHDDVSEVHKITDIREDSYTYMTSANYSYNLYGYRICGDLCQNNGDHKAIVMQ